MLNKILDINNLVKNIAYIQSYNMNYGLCQLLKNSYFNKSDVDIINIINYFYYKKNNYITEVDMINLIISINHLDTKLPLYEIYKLAKIANYDFQTHDFKVVINLLFHKYFFESDYNEKNFFIYYRLFKLCLSNKYNSIIHSNIADLFYFYEKKCIPYKFYNNFIIKLMQSISIGVHFFEKNTNNIIIQKFNNLFPEYKNKLQALITLQEINN